jgi:hypothetical protein
MISYSMKKFFSDLLNKLQGIFQFLVNFPEQCQILLYQIDAKIEAIPISGFG